jgi:multidrug resistance efflux pump
MSLRTALSARDVRRTLWTASGLAALLALGWWTTLRGSAADGPGADVTRGEFVDVVELRGDVRPLKSVVLASPMQAGELQIVKLARTGTAVKAGDVVVEFDGSTLARTVQEKQTELKQVDAEIDQERAQARITEEESTTSHMRARFDVDRTGLDVIERDFVARLAQERARLMHDDARHRLRETEQRVKADAASTLAKIAIMERKRDKVAQDLARAERALDALQLRAPSDGTVNVMPNPRSSGPMGGEQEFREGDRAWAGAAVIELPDVSEVHLAARLEEADRSRVQSGQTAAVRVDAILDKEFRAVVKDISVLARVDFSTWPPTRDFDMRLSIDTPDPRLRPGMSATARIAVGRLKDVLLVPSDALFTVDGRPTVYRAGPSGWEPQAVNVLKRGRDQAALASGVQPGDRVSLRKPSPAGRGRQ